MNKQEFVKYTKDVWQPYYEKTLSDFDAVEITNNMVDFMNLLIRWDKEDREAKNNLARLTLVEQNKEKDNQNE